MALKTDVAVDLRNRPVPSLSFTKAPKHKQREIVINVISLTAPLARWNSWLRKENTSSNRIELLWSTNTSSEVSWSIYREYWWIDYWTFISGVIFLFKGVIMAEYSNPFLKLESSDIQKCEKKIEIKKFFKIWRRKMKISSNEN